MYRSLAAIAITSALVIAAAPAQAKPEPIRGFAVTVKGDQIRATAQIPGPVGRKAQLQLQLQLQQRDNGRWVTFAQTRTKPAKGAATPRARWRVAIADLRLPSAQSRAQAGPLSELIRLRAKSGKSTSKPQKVRVKSPSTVAPVYPKFVTGSVEDIYVSDSEEREARWNGQVRFQAYQTDGYLFRYRLASANLAWSLKDDSGLCTVNAKGMFTASDLTAEGFVDAPKRYEAGDAPYNFIVSHGKTLPVQATCQDGTIVTYDYPPLPLTLNTLTCPTGSTIGTFATYFSQPWTNQDPSWVFAGQRGRTDTGCSDFMDLPGLWSKWNLTGSEPACASSTSAVVTPAGTPCGLLPAWSPDFRTALAGPISPQTPAPAGSGSSLRHRPASSHPPASGSPPRPAAAVA
jgi:hypothetical protein